MAFRRVVSLLVLGYAFGATGAAAQGGAQEAEVRSAVSATLQAWEDGDFPGFASFYDTQARGFFLDGGVLLEGINAQALQTGYDAGVRAEFQVRDLDVRIVGGVAASNAYLDGSLTLPGGMVQSGTWRYTETRVREGGTWKVIQFHFSEMTAAPR